MSSSGTAPSHGRAVVAVTCLVLTSCAAEGRPGTGQAPAAAAVDWRNTAYTLTCDGVVPEGLRAVVEDGSARISADASRPPHYQYYDVHVRGTATGDVDGDGASDAVVLLECSPQPSNGILQEVELLSSIGELLGTLPS